MVSTGRVFAVLSCYFLFVPFTSQSETPLEQLRVLALAPAAGEAVLRWPDGRLRVVRGGEALDGTDIRVLQVLPDRLVLEEVLTSASQSARRQLVWLYKAPQAGGASRLIRLHREPPAYEQPVGEAYQAVSGPAQ